MIVEACQKDLDACVDILFSSEMGRTYYPTRKALAQEVLHGIENDRVFVFVREGVQPETQGVVWYQPRGMFHAFAYLHMIAVKDECQNQGIGTALLNFFEQDALKTGKNRMRTKVFLTVGSFNAHAEELYRRRGYEFICELPGLFRRNVTEKLMSKTVTAQ